MTSEVRPPAGGVAARLAAVEAGAVLLVIALALYSAIVYAFAFTQAGGAARDTVHLAIAAMDLLIAWQILRHGRPYLRLFAAPGNSRALVLVLLAIAMLALAAVGLLHADYVLARRRGAEDGVVGSLLRLKTYLLAAQLACVCALALARSVARAGAGALRPAPPAASDALLLLLPAIPLVNYLAHNVELFTVARAVEYLLFFLFWPVAAALVLSGLRRALPAPAAAAPLVAGLAFVYYAMPLVASSLGRPVETLFLVHLGLAVGVPLILAALYWLDRRTLATGVAVFAAGAMAVSVVQARTGGRDAAPAAPAEGGARDAAAGDALLGALAADARRTPDVYLLVYDGYAPSSVLEQLGIVEEEQDRYLRDRGFTMYDEAYSLYMSSRPSMASVLDMRAVAQQGIGGENTAIRFLRRQGYTTHLVLNSYLLQGDGPPAADSAFPPWHSRADVGALYRGIAGGEFKSEIVFADRSRDEWLAAKRALLAAPDGAPRMLYAHSGYPGHSQNSGTCLPDETRRYAARLDVARDEMRTDVETILASGRDAIVIVAADHGPFLTGDCLYLGRTRPEDVTAAHLADRYGAKLAIRWPGGASAPAGEIAVIQDVFFAVAAYLLEDARVWRFRPPPETVGYDAIPHGAIRNGIVTTGKDEGLPLWAGRPPGR